MSESMRPHHSASSERAQFIFLSSLSGTNTKIDRTSYGCRRRSKTSSSNYSHLECFICTVRTPRPFDPFPIRTSGVLSHLREFATIRLPLQ